MTPEQEERAARVIGTSASDCETEMVLSASRIPVSTLGTVAETLKYMNDRKIEKISHRRALVKAGRAALKKLSEV